MSELDDHDLLARYARENSEAAFAALADRHVNLVYSVALRSTGNPHAAQEITQAVFIILARKAGQLSRRVVLSGWLYQTTRLTAANFLRTEIRRQKREQEAYMQSTFNEPEDNVWPQIAPLLDDALARLGERDRNAIVLRFFENKNLLEVGLALGASEDAAKMRVNRALEKLRKFFTKRGVTLSATVIAGAVSTNSIQAAPLGLAKTITVVAMAKGATAGGSTLALAKGAMKLMAWTKTTMAVGALVVVGISTTLIIRHHEQRNNYAEQRPQAKSADEDKAIAISKMNDAKQFVLGMLMYAHDHQSQFPASFEQMASYFKSNQDVLSNSGQFEIVYQGSLGNIADPNSVIIAMDKKPWLTSHGTWAKTYGFADGHTAVRAAPFEAFEQSHMNPPPNH